MDFGAGGMAAGNNLVGLGVEDEVRLLGFQRREDVAHRGVEG